MSHLNVEIKAKCRDPKSIREYLLERRADYKGLDLQTDTYFNVLTGRLKLRQGDIENNLIYYDRNDQPGPKSSKFSLVRVEDAQGLKHFLEDSCGIRMVVTKSREIYYLDNVKFHIDDVPGLGQFVEVEAGNLIGDRSEAELLEQCNFYLKEIGIEEADLIAESYCDMLIKLKEVT